MSATQCAVARRIGRRRCWDCGRASRWYQPASPAAWRVPVEFGEGLCDAADSEGGVDATKPSLGCFNVIDQDADLPTKSFLRRRSCDNSLNGAIAEWLGV